MASGSDCESDVELMASTTRGTVRRLKWWRLCSPAGSYSVAPDCTVPRDRGRSVYVCMLLAGAGFLFPWTSYITAIDYFFFLYWKDFHHVSVVVAMTYMMSTWLFTAFNVTIVNTISLHVRIGLGYVLFLMSLLAVPLLDLLVHYCLLSTHISFYLTILSVAVVGIGSGVQQSSYYGLAGMLPQQYPQAVMAGESVAALVVSINRIITKVSTSSERFGAIAFFLVSIVFILVCVCCQQFLRTSAFVKYHVRQCGQYHGARGVGEGTEGVGEGTEGVGEGTEEIRLKRVDGGSDNDDQEMLLTMPRPQLSLSSKLRAGLLMRLGVMAEIWKLLVAVFSSFFITLLVFPGLVSEVQYCAIGDWAPILLVTVFSVTDLITKWVALVPVRWSSTGLMIGALLRAVLLLPILLLVTPSPSQPLIHPGTLAWAIVLVALLGLSNGYFGSLPMIVFSGKLKSPQHLEVAGTIMTLFLLTGLMLGSVLAFALTPLTTLRHYDKCPGNSTFFDSCLTNSTQ